MNANGHSHMRKTNGRSKKKPKQTIVRDAVELEAEAIQVARRIQSAYGHEGGLRRLIQMFGENLPGPSIAKAFKVSRQRVNQWRHVLGKEERAFVLNPCIEKLLGERPDA